MGIRQIEPIPSAMAYNSTGISVNIACLMLLQWRDFYRQPTTS